MQRARGLNQKLAAQGALVFKLTVRGEEQALLVHGNLLGVLNVGFEGSDSVRQFED